MKLRLIILIVLALIVGKSNAQLAFADRCAGRWQGTMLLWNNGILKDSVPVVLTVRKLNDSSWGWRTDYISSNTTITKNYKLLLKDKINNRFVTDEGDGILLDNYLFANKLYSVFETAGALLTASYELLGNVLVFEVTSGKKCDSLKNNFINYGVTAVQRVELVRK